MPRDKYSMINHCRSCRSTDLQSVYSVPPIPVAGIYYDSDAAPANLLAPMTLAVCDVCGLVQLRETISPDIYRDYSFVGNSALSYQAHLEMLAHSLVSEWGVSGKRVFEIGASNGVLLGLLAEIGKNYVAGIEPSGKLCEAAVSNGVSVVQGYFNQTYLSHSHPGTFDCILIRHVLEHIDDLNDMVESMRSILDDKGLLVVEIPDLHSILQNTLLSNIFHEHLNYFSRESMATLLNRHGLAVVDQRLVDIHGGALLLLCRVEKKVAGKECNHESLPLHSFATQAANYYARLRELVRHWRGLGKTVHGFGASHRTFVLLGNSGLGKDDIPVIYDSNPFLHNKRLNGLHCLVQHKEAIREQAPDVLIIFATSYEAEIASYLVNDCGYSGEILSVRYEAICEQC